MKIPRKLPLILNGILLILTATLMITTNAQAQANPARALMTAAGNCDFKTVRDIMSAHGFAPMANPARTLMTAAGNCDFKKVNEIMSQMFGYPGQTNQTRTLMNNFANEDSSARTSINSGSTDVAALASRFVNGYSSAATNINSGSADVATLAHRFLNVD